MKKNHFGGREVVGQTRALASWAQKVDKRLLALPNGLRRQWLIAALASGMGGVLEERLASSPTR